VKSAAPVLAAGGTFAFAAIGGLFAGAWLAARLNAPLLGVAGLFVGLAIGGYSAFRMLMRSV
jgi:hypothetical protein